MVMIPRQPPVLSLSMYTVIKSNLELYTFADTLIKTKLTTIRYRKCSLLAHSIFCTA